MTSFSLTRVLKSICGFIYKYKFSILFAVLLLIATQCIERLAPSKPALFSAVMILLFINTLSKINNKIIKVALTTVFAIFISFDVYFAFVYSSIITNAIMGAFLETNVQEAKEALGAAWGLGLLAILVSVSLIVLSVREMKQSKLSLKASLVSLVVYSFVFIPGLVYYKINLVPEWLGEYRQAPLVSLNAHVNAHFPFIYGNLTTFVWYGNERNKMRSYVLDERSLPQGVVLSDSAKSADKIIFLLGESANRKYFSLYGSRVKTTPFLDSLAMTSSLNFHEGISPAPATRDALRFILTFASPRDQHPFFTQKSLVDLAKDAGYEVHWISTQSSAEIMGSYVDLISANAEEFYFKNGQDNEDLDVVAKMKEVYDVNKKQLFILHTQGSHFSYQYRYDEKDVIGIPGDDEGYMNLKLMYDRTVHHTDRLIRELYDVAKQDTSSIVCYFPDHSEIVGIGHGFLNVGTAQYEIPFVVLNSSPIDVDPIVSKYLTRPSGTPLLNTVNSIYILSEFMGYTISPDLVRKTVDEGEYILQGDGRVYTFQYLEAQN